MAAQTADSAPAEPKDFAEYQSLGKTSDSPTDVAPEGGEPAPDSDPDNHQEPKALTAEEKAERKRRNDERRERRWYEERGEMRARLSQLERENQELRGKGKPEEPYRPEGKPTLKAFLESGKFQTYEDAQEAYLDARHDWDRRQAAEEREANARKEQDGNVKQAFQKSLKTYRETHEDFDDNFQAVRERLDEDARHVSHAIVHAEHPAEVIDYLGQHPEEMDRIAGLSPERATIAIGRIDSRFDKKDAAPERKEPPNAPRPPKHVGGRGSAPSRDDQLREAAEKNDFASFRKTLHAQK